MSQLAVTGNARQQVDLESVSLLFVKLSFHREATLEKRVVAPPDRQTMKPSLRAEIPQYLVPCK